jgi:hypothetical protein
MQLLEEDEGRQAGASLPEVQRSGICCSMS